MPRQLFPAYRKSYKYQQDFLAALLFELVRLLYVLLAVYTYLQRRSFFHCLCHGFGIAYRAFAASEPCQYLWQKLGNKLSADINLRSRCSDFLLLSRGDFFHFKFAVKNRVYGGLFLPVSNRITASVLLVFDFAAIITMLPNFGSISPFPYFSALH